MSKRCDCLGAELMSSDDSRLRPCPRCGGEATLNSVIRTTSRGDGYWLYYVHCKRCAEIKRHIGPATSPRPLMVDFDGYDEDNYLAHKRAEEAVIDFGTSPLMTHRHVSQATWKSFTATVSVEHECDHQASSNAHARNHLGPGAGNVRR